MLNQSLKMYKVMPHLLKVRYLTQAQNVNVHSCICGQVFLKAGQRNSSYSKNVRVHSTQSDQHRQKVVMETSSPVIEKLESNSAVIEKLRENVLDKDQKKDWRGFIRPYKELARWDKPIGVYLLYWPCTWSISLATITSGVPLATSIHTAGLFLAGAGLMRGAGCTLNDMWDRDIDKQVERTERRPLVTGAVSMKQATGFLALQLSGALAILLQLNCNSIAIGAASCILVATYPLAKRFTNYPQVFLGATFNWGALLGYSAITGVIDPYICVPLYLGALAWTVVYDTIYAHQDKLDDARIGMKSTALTFGSHTKPALTATLLASTGLLAGTGCLAELSAPYYMALAAYVTHVGRQIYTLDIDNPQDCADKFKSNSLVGLIILLGILAGGYDRYKQTSANGNKGETARGCITG